MKASRDAIASAKRLFRLCMKEGRLNEDHLRKVFKTIADKKPRNFQGILVTLKDLTRMELARHEVTIESAEVLGAARAAQIEAELKKKHGEQISFEYKVLPELLGGIRIKKADDVWDGSLKSKIDRLQEAF